MVMVVVVGGKRFKWKGERIEVWGERHGSIG